MTDAAILAALSDRLAALVAQAASSIVAVDGGRRPTSGMHWRPGVVVTAEEGLERDEDVTLTLPDGRSVPATLAGRDPSTDVAVLRFQPDGLAVAATGDAGGLRAGEIVLAVGRLGADPVAAQGIVALAGGPWQSRRGGSIDRLVRLDLRLAAAAEGGALLDTAGRVVGMTVPGPRRRALAIPASTIDRVTDQLLATGRIARGYLGAGLQPVRLPETAAPGGRGLVVLGVDPQGPAAAAGLMVGDVLLRWRGETLAGMRDLMRRLGPESVGERVELDLLRGGAPAKATLTVGERPAG